MRRLIGAGILACVLLAPACRRALPEVEVNEDQNQPAASVVSAANPRTAGQFLSGFHQVEENSYRWTERKFSVILQPPAGAAQKGAALELKFHVSEPVIARRKAVTLSASAEGTPLAPQTYDRAGDYVYSRDVPASAVSGGTMKIDFSLDRFLAAGEVESRELGVAVMSAGLRPK